MLTKSLGERNAIYEEHNVWYTVGTLPYLSQMLIVIFFNFKRSDFVCVRTTTSPSLANQSERTSS